MKKTIITLIFLILILNTGVTAIDSTYLDNIELDNNTINQIKNYINTEYTENKAINTLKSTFGDEILEVTLTETNQTFTLKTENGTLQTIKRGSDPESTMKLKLNETIFDDFKSVEASNDPAQLILDSINSDKIQYSTTENASWKTKIYLFLSKIMLKIATLIKMVI